MLTGSITRLLKPTLDLHTTLPYSHLILLELTVLVCQSLLETFVAKRNGKDGHKTTLTGSMVKLRQLNLDLLTTALLFKPTSILLALMVQVIQPFLVLFKVRNNGKVGLKTMLIGSIKELRSLKLDFHTHQPLSNLTRERCLMSKLSTLLTTFFLINPRNHKRLRRLKTTYLTLMSSPNLRQSMMILHNSKVSKWRTMKSLLT